MNRTEAARYLAAGGLVWIGSLLFAAPATRPGTQPATQPATGESLTIERRFISADDIQKIRRGELRTVDTARIQIPQDVRRAYANKRGISYSEFNAKPAIEQALDILDNGDESMQSHVKVMTDPQALIEYKKLQPMIVTGCAAIGCHGGMNGGNLLLFPSESEPATYTDFYILTQFAPREAKSSSGVFDGATQRGLIQRGHGEMSILAQYGLPPGKAKIKHPPVNGYNGIFRDTEDPRFKRLVDWMNIALRPIEPDYAINYVLPRGRNSDLIATTQASTKPSTKPTSKPSTRPIIPPAHGR